MGERFAARRAVRCTGSSRRTTPPASAGSRAARSSTSSPTAAASSSSSAPCRRRTRCEFVAAVAGVRRTNESCRGCARPPPRPRIQFEEVLAYPGLPPAADTDFARLCRELTGTPAPAKVSFGTEGGCFAARGIPALVCGPGDIAVAHKPDEWIALEQLERCDALSARAHAWGPDVALRSRASAWRPRGARLSRNWLTRAGCGIAAISWVRHADARGSVWIPTPRRPGCRLVRQGQPR